MKCPICGEQTGHANNHVRMTDGDGHGPMSEYPEGWDKDQGDFDPEAFAVETEEDDETEENDSESDVQIDPEPDPEHVEADDEREELTFADTEADASEYECGECGEPLEYLGGKNAEGGGKECPNCAEALYWSMM